MIRLGAPQFGVITADVEGDKPSTWLSKSGEIINRIAINAGVAAGKIDAASLTALDSVVSTLTSGGGIIGLYLTEQASVIDVARRIARPLNAVAGISFLGKLFVARIAIGTPTLTLDAQGKSPPATRIASEESVSPPFKQIRMGAARTWRVHTPDEIQTGYVITPRGLHNPLLTYRQGDFVSLADGSTFIYINQTASAGNAPPNVTYWGGAR
jgi:hypothetical protein